MDVVFTPHISSDQIRIGTLINNSLCLVSNCLMKGGVTTIDNFYFKNSWQHW